MSRALRLVLAGLLAALLVGAPAQAAPRSPDPERGRAVVHAAQRPATRTLPTLTAPASLDSDVYVYVTTTSSRTYFVAAGHLQLALKSGSATRYGGSFVDYVGNTSYKASADTTNAGAPTLTLGAKNGKFAFRMNASFGTVAYDGQATGKPSKLKVPTDQVYIVASAHVVRSASFSLFLSERSGAINNPIEYAGTLTIAYDANGRISGGQVVVTNGKGKNVTHALHSSGFYNAGYFYTVAQVDKKFFGLTGTVSGTSVDGFGFAADGSRTTQWVLTGTA